MHFIDPLLIRRRLAIRPLCLTALGFVAAPLCIAADSPKVKIVESCDRVDLKALRINQAQVKSVLTQDPEHRKVLEMVMDYAVAGGRPGFGKDFPAVNLQKFQAIRFWVRSDFGTTFSVGIGGEYKRADGKSPGFWTPGTTASENWTQITIPLEKFMRHEVRTWDKDKKVWVVIPGGDRMDAQDYAGISRWGIVA
jgi:hypothetical protein